MIKVLIADDHPIICRGLRQILAEERDVSVVAEAHSGDEVLAQVARYPCAVLLMDITMPGKSWLDVLGELRRTRPALPVLILSIHPEDQYAVRALRAGAAGYLTKDSAPDELVKAIRRVVGGHRYISPSLAQELAGRLENGAGSLVHENLSDREYLVLCLLASGKTVSQIAEQLSLSVKTISTYRSRILTKMGMQTTAELVHYAISHRLTN